MQFHLRLEKIKNSQKFSKSSQNVLKMSQKFSNRLKKSKFLKISQKFSKISQKLSNILQNVSKMQLNSAFVPCQRLKIRCHTHCKDIQHTISPGLKKIKSSQKFSNRNVHARKNTFAWCLMRIFFSVRVRVRARVYAVGRVAWLNCKQHISSGNEQT